jgi:enoyl-CoA hydratase/carnithine racemase
MKVLFEKKGPLAYVTINRPERLNACDGETYRMLTAVWREFRDDPALRVGILTGVGERAFCVGTDVKAHDFARLSAEPHHLPFSLLSDLGKPLIAAINGHANGSGLEQALYCDIRVAAEHAQFGLGDARLGWLPAAGGTQRLPRLIPLGRALELLYTGNRIGAQEAWRLGLVDHVVPMSQLMGKCEEIAAEICQSAPLAVQNIKHAVRRGLELPLAEGLKLEQDLSQELQETDDAREGARAFAEKRAPQWQGK